MKITLEPTESQRGKSLDTMHKNITIELPCDDCDVYAALEMCCDALIAWGFHKDSVAECLDPEFASYNMDIAPCKTDLSGENN